MGRIVQKIYWSGKDTPKDENGNKFANVHILEGYSQGSITDYTRMLRLLRKTFPGVKMSEVRCSKITKSHSYNGFTLLIWDAYLPKECKIGEEWTQTENKIEYWFS